MKLLLSKKFMVLKGTFKMMEEIMDIKTRILEKNRKLIDSEISNLKYEILNQDYTPVITKLYTVKDGNIPNLMSTSNQEIFMAIIYSILENIEAINRLNQNVKLKLYLNNTPLFDLMSDINDIVQVVDDDYDAAVEKLHSIHFTEKVTDKEINAICLYFLIFLSLKRIVGINKTLNNGRGMSRKALITYVEQKRYSDYIEVFYKNLRKCIVNNQDNLRFIRGQIKAHEEILEAIKNNELENITEIPTLWYEYADEMVAFDILAIISKNHNKKYDEEMVRNQKLKEQIERTPLTKFLYTNQIDPNKIAKPYYTKLENNYDMPFILDFLMKLNFPLKKLLSNQETFILFLTNDIVKELAFLLNSQVITEASLISHLPTIEKWYLKFKTNYDILKNLVDFKNEFYNGEILFLEPTEIRERLSVLKEYSLSKNNYMFLLSNYQYLSYYDLMLEKGISPVYFISICTSPDPLLTIKKILISESINEAYLLPSGVLARKVTEKQKFICADEEVDQYLENENLQPFNRTVSGGISTITSNNLVKLLDENYCVGHMYRFDGVLISRPKFLRLAEKQETLDYANVLLALEYNSILSTTDLLKIQNCLKRLYGPTKQI